MCNDVVMSDLRWEEVIVYLNEVIILGIDFSITIAALHKVLDRFCQHNLKLKCRKWQFFGREVEFCGTLVSLDDM